MTGRATVKDLRQRNRAAVLRRIVLAGETTRAKVAADCALSSATVTNVVSDLMREGLVEENGSLPSDGGRPIARLRAAAGAAHLIGADVGEHGVTVELFDLSLSRVDRVFSTLPTRVTSLDRVAEAVSGAVASIRAANPAQEPSLIGIGLGLPGIVDTTADGTTTIYAQSLGWRPIRLDQLFQAPGVPVFADNGAKTLATAEMWFGAARGVPHSIVALVGRGLGIGVIAGGRLLRGLSSSAGEWGHTKVSIGGPACQCGGRGCLEAYVGGDAIVRRWRETGADVVGSDEQGLAQLITAAEEGDAAAAWVLDETHDIHDVRGTSRRARRRRVPARLRLGSRHGRVPDRGRRDRGRPRTVHMGHLRPHAGADGTRRDRRRRLRPLPPVGAGPGHHRRPGPARLPDVSVVGAPAAGRAGTAQPRCGGPLPAAAGPSGRAGCTRVRDAVPLGPAPAAGGRRWLAGPCDRRAVRRVRRLDRTRPGRPRTGLDHPERAMVLGVPRLRLRRTRAGSYQHPRRGRGRPPPQPGPRAGSRRDPARTPGGRRGSHPHPDRCRSGLRLPARSRGRRPVRRQQQPDVPRPSAARPVPRGGVRALPCRGPAGAGTRRG